MDTKYFFNLLVADSREGNNSIKTIHTDDKQSGIDQMVILADKLMAEGQKCIMQAFQMCEKTFAYKLVKEVRV